MSHRNLFLLALLCATASVQAQDGYVVYDFQNNIFDITDQYGDTEHTFLFGYFNHVSANGKYAVGTDEQLMCRAFLWSDENPTEIQMFGDYNSEIALFDVTNDGTIVGGIRDSRGVMYPAYKPLNGNWQMLTRGMENLNYDMAVDDYVSMAIRAVTPDGRYMAGSFYINTGEYSDEGYEVSHLVPVLWEDGMLKKIYDDLGMKEFMVWDISDDGSIICGSNTSGIGGSNPAFIRNGELIELFDCGDERTADTPDDVYGNTEGGICNNIDNMGNIYGYYMEAYGDSFFDQHFFIVPADCDYAIFVDPDYTNDKFPEDYYYEDWYRCGGNGTCYTNDDSHIYSLVDCSDDGKVFVGGGDFNLGYGLTNVPQICVYDEPLAPVSLRDAYDTDHTHGVSFNGRTLIIKGVYQEAKVFDAKGALVAQAKQGQPIKLSGESDGVYMVTVQYADGMHSYKITK